jgi:hypothetical protein
VNQAVGLKTSWGRVGKLVKTYDLTSYPPVLFGPTGEPRLPDVVPWAWLQAVGLKTTVGGSAKLVKTNDLATHSPVFSDLLASLGFQTWFPAHGFGQ